MTKEEIIKSALKFLVQKQIEQGSWGFSDADDDEISWDEVIGWLEQEPCGDCISREGVLYEAKYYADRPTDTFIKDVLKQLPSVQPQPKMGKWKGWNVVRIGNSADMREGEE